MTFSICRIGLLAISISLAACKPDSQSANQSALSEIASSKKLKVGYVLFPPCVTKDPTTGELGGHFVATVREIAKQAGWTVDFQEADWTTFAAGLNTRRFDLSIAPTFVTIPRATAVAFSQPLFYAGNSAIVKRGDTRFTDVASFDKAGIRIAVTQGEAGHEYAKANFKNAEITVHSGADQMLTFQDVLTGRADVALGDAYVTGRFAAEHGDAVKDLFAANPYNLTPVAWGVRLGDVEMLSFINACIGSLEVQGKLAQFEEASGAHWLHVKRDWISR